MEPSSPGPTFPIFFGTRRGPTGPGHQAISGRGICYLRWFPGAPRLQPFHRGVLVLQAPRYLPECRRGKRLALGVVPLSAQSSSAPRRQSCGGVPYEGQDGWHGDFVTRRPAQGPAY